MILIGVDPGPSGAIGLSRPRDVGSTCVCLSQVPRESGSGILFPVSASEVVHAAPKAKEDHLTHMPANRREIDMSATAVASAPTSVLMEGIVAAYALMAHADGEVAGAERRRIFAILRECPAIAALSRADLVEAVAQQEANYRYDPEVAQEMAREKLAPLAGDRRSAARIVAACRALISADGVAHPAEYRALKDIKALLAFEDRTSLAAGRQS